MRHSYKHDKSMEIPKTVSQHWVLRHFWTRDKAGDMGEEGMDIITQK